MVKPSKAMQPEAVNLKKAGRDTSKAFGEDSFRNYIARKIALQRQQFGLVLPPVDAQDAFNVIKTPEAATVDSPDEVCSPSDPSPLPIVGASKRKRFGIDGIVKRLRRKHGEQSVKPILLEQTIDRFQPGESIANTVSSPLSSLPVSSVAGEANLVVPTASQLFVSTCQESPSKATDQPALPNCHLVGSPYAWKHRSDLFFHGVVVLINGYTNPDAETLQRLLHKHGGDVEKYETSRVTHIIAEQLSTAKANMYRAQRNPRPVCRPTWIMDSIEQGRKLSYAAYLLDEVRKESTALTMPVASYFKPKQTIPTTSEAKANSCTSPVDSTNGSIQSPQKERFVNGKIRTVGTDPNFLESFFAASRLSFIGSYKQRIGRSPTKAPISDGKDTTRYIFHVDMDCFFASVALRNFPEYRDKPVAISHHGIRNGEEYTDRKVPLNSSSECATCNYAARQYGVKKGMYLGRAKALCPELIILQYDFEGYEEVSEAVHEILLRHSTKYNGFVEQVSCDESYVEVFLPKGSDSQARVSFLAETIRSEILESTQCTATVGVASNKLLSKLATDFAKPNKSYVVENPRTLLRGLALHQLPGVGYHLSQKLKGKQLVLVDDVWKRGLAAEKDLCDIVGNLTGKKLFGYCQGIDDRELKPNLRKTIGAECNYGVRFDGPHGPDHMIRSLCREVEKRMTDVGVRCKKVTIKIKQRKPGSPPPPKFLGHGSCFNHSKSEILPSQATRSSKVLFVTAMNLFNELKIPDKDIRGMGIVASDLIHGDHSFSESSEVKISKLFDAHRKRSTLAVSPHPSKSGRFDQKAETNCGIYNALNEMSFSAPFRIDKEVFALPNLSQIHMSQVDELPSPMRRAIMSQVYGVQKTVSRLDATQSYQQTNVQRMFRRVDPTLSVEPQEACVLQIVARQEDSFEQEMSKPFAQFMDQHSAAEDDNVRHVITFMCQCVSEGRVADVVKLLRLLRYRSDRWTRSYNRVLEAVDDKVECCMGNRLDRDWSLSTRFSNED